MEVANIVAINFTIVIPKILKPKRDRFRDAYPPDYLSPLISTFFFAPSNVFSTLLLFLCNRKRFLIKRRTLVRKYPDKGKNIDTVSKHITKKTA